EINRHVCLRATVRLHVRVIGAKQLFRAIDRSLLDNVSPFTTAVITLARITLGVLVCEHRTRSLKHGLTDKVFRSNELEPISLACYFIVDSARDNRIDFGE